MSGRWRRTRRRSELSQHFLRSRSLAARLVEQSTISRSDLVIEIGPGSGILTHELAERSGRLIAVELDERLSSWLRTTFENVDYVDIMLGDFPEFPLPTCAFKVFGNIPYSATAATIRRLVDAHIRSMAWAVLVPDPRIAPTPHITSKSTRLSLPFTGSTSKPSVSSAVTPMIGGSSSAPNTTVIPPSTSS